METLKKFFPYSFKSASVKDLVITIIIHVVIGVLCGVVLGLLGAIPFVGILTKVLGTVIDLYLTVGIVLAILAYVGVLKD